MKRLHLFLIKSFIGPFIATFFIAIFILLMQFLWKYIDDLVGKGLELSEITELLFYASARFIPIALPIAILLSSVMTFGKLGEQYELIALKAAGISLYKIMTPLLIIVITLSYCSFLFSNYIMPIANLKNGSMIYDIQKKKPALNIKEGIFYNNIEGFSIKVEKKNIDGVNLKGILIYDHTNSNGNTNVIIADSGSMKVTYDEKYLEFKLYNGYSYIDLNDKKRNTVNAYRRSSFKEDIILFNLASFNKMSNSEKLYKGHYAMLNNNQLSKAIDSLKIKLNERKIIFRNNLLDKYNTKFITKKNNSILPYSKMNKGKFNIALNNLKAQKAIIKSNKNDLEYRKIIITKHKIEWHRKISLSFACIIFFLIGAPLGSIIRKGGFGFPVLISILFFLLYHVLSIIGEKSAKELNIEAIQGMWLANLVFIPIALFIIYKAKNNVKIFNLYKWKFVINRTIKNKILN